MDMLGFASIAAITVICYLAALIVKATPLNNKWLPSICGMLGGVLGIIAMKYMPSFPAQDLFSSIAIGIVGGLASTGVHQMCKEFLKPK